MATPFLQEEEQETDGSRPLADPWEGPSKPSWYTGLAPGSDTPLYAGAAGQIVTGMGSAFTKAGAALSSLYSEEYGLYAKGANALGVPAAGKFLKSESDIWQSSEAQLRQNVQALTPDPSTTGVAANMLHGVAEGGTLMLEGGGIGGPLGAAISVGGTEGTSRAQELEEAGIDRGTAIKSGLVTGATSALGAVLPAAYGETLLARVLTGVASNTAFGVVSRYADHTILANAGYTEMADQQKALDTTQMLADAALGATFGVVHHALAGAPDLHTPENEDAALTVNLAARDRQAAPGVPVDPHSAELHSAAMDKASADIAAERPVDVTDTGVHEGTFLPRAERDVTPEMRVIMDSFKESGLLDQEANLRDLESMFATKQEATPTREMPVKAQGEDTVSLDDPFEQALAERPNMKIPDEDGSPIKASDAMEQAADTTKSDEFDKAAKTAAECFNRRGA